MPLPTFEFEIGGTPSQPDAEHVGFVDALRAEATEAMALASRDRDGLRSHILDTYGPIINEMYFLRDNAAEAVNWAARAVDDSVGGTPDGDAFSAYHVVQRGLLAKSLLSFGEAVAMVEAGYSAGAFTRVRTMYEVLIVALVLAAHGHPESEHPELPDRFLEHRRAFHRSFAQDYLAGYGTTPDSIFDSEILGQLDEQHDDLVSRYGRGFMRAWGWAAPLFEGRPASMTGLVKMVVPQLAVLYPMMSSPVHAGSDGWHDLIRDSGEFQVYPNAEALDAPIELASAFVLLTSEAVIPKAIVHEGSEPDRTGEAFLSGLADSRRRIAQHLSAL